MQIAHEHINTFMMSQAPAAPEANALSAYDEDPNLLLFAVHDPLFLAEAPTWVCLDETTVDELVEYLMVWKIRKKARDGG